MLADRNFACFKLWRAAAAAGAHLCWRMAAPLTHIMHIMLVCARSAIS